MKVSENNRGYDERACKLSKKIKTYIEVIV